MTFSYEYRTTWGKRRAYPISELAHLLLALNQAREAKSFTEEQLNHIRDVAEMVGFEVVEVRTEHSRLEDPRIVEAQHQTLTAQAQQQALEP